jgi:Septum formation initiator
LQPVKILALCALFLMANLVVDGSLFQLWKLYRDQNEIQSRMLNLKEQNGDLKMRVARASFSRNTGSLARERFDLVKEGDLVFVFAEEEGEVQ